MAHFFVPDEAADLPVLEPPFEPSRRRIIGWVRLRSSGVEHRAIASGAHSHGIAP
jgi:hypothetical protein